MIDDNQILDSILLPFPQEMPVLNTKTDTIPTRTFVIKISIPNPYKNGVFVQKQRLMQDVPINKTTTELINVIKPQLDKELQTYDFYIKYNNILYEDVTIQDIGIKNDTVVELECLTQTKLATKNEGFFLCYWSVLPLILALSFLAGGLIGRFDMLIRAVYLVIFTILGVPFIILEIIGCSEYYPELTKTSMVGSYWFCNKCNCKCNCCSKKDQDQDNEPLLGAEN